MSLSCAEELRREPILRQAIEFSTDDAVRRGGVRRAPVRVWFTSNCVWTAPDMAWYSLLGQLPNELEFGAGGK